MSTEVTVALIVTAGGSLTVFGNYLVGKRQSKVEERKNSGDITTSDAAALWEESNKLRQEYKDQAEMYKAQLEKVNAKLQQVMSQLTALKGNSDKMIRKIDELKKVIAKLRRENARLIAKQKAATNATS